MIIFCTRFIETADCRVYAIMMSRRCQAGKNCTVLGTLMLDNTPIRRSEQSHNKHGWDRVSLTEAKYCRCLTGEKCQRSRRRGLCAGFRRVSTSLLSFPIINFKRSSLSARLFAFSAPGRGSQSEPHSAYIGRSIPYHPVGWTSILAMCRSLERHTLQTVSKLHVLDHDTDANLTGTLRGHQQ